MSRDFAHLEEHSNTMELDKSALAWVGLLWPEHKKSRLSWFFPEAATAKQSEAGEAASEVALEWFTQIVSMSRNSLRMLAAGNSMVLVNLFQQCALWRRLSIFQAAFPKEWASAAEIERRCGHVILSFLHYFVAFEWKYYTWLPTWYLDRLLALHESRNFLPTDPFLSVVRLPTTYLYELLMPQQYHIRTADSPGIERPQGVSFCSV